MKFYRITVSTSVHERKAEDLEKIFEATFDDYLSGLRTDYRREIKQQFQSEGVPKWKELSPKYAARKKKIVGDKPILQFKEKLRIGYSKGGRIEKKKLIFDFPTPYARRHQFGDDTINLPQRAINLDFVEKLAMVRINSFLRRTANKAGFKAKFFKSK